MAAKLFVNKKSGNNADAVPACVGMELKTYNPFSDRYLSASMAARHPIPAAVMAWR